jgi:hypothetical protein
VKKLIAISAAAVMLAALGPALGSVWDDWLPPNVVNKATKLVRAKATFKKAVLLEADGTTANHGKVSTAKGMTKWHIVFDNQSSVSIYASVFVNANKGHFGKVTGVLEPFLEDRRITRTPKMTLVTAVKKLRAKHYSGGFYNVTLRWPLGPGFDEPLYIFGFGQNAKHPYVSVGTRTGHVKPIS